MALAIPFAIGFFVVALIGAIRRGSGLAIFMLMMLLIAGIVFAALIGGLIYIGNVQMGRI